MPKLQPTRFPVLLGRQFVMRFETYFFLGKDPEFDLLRTSYLQPN